MYVVGGPVSHNTKKVKGCVDSPAQPKGNGTAQTGFLEHLCHTSAPKLQTPFTSIKREQNYFNSYIFVPFQMAQ